MPGDKRRDRAGNRLFVVSNRLPVVVSRTEDGGWQVAPGPGGLVTALAPVLRNRGGIWIGWPGVVEEEAEGLASVLQETDGDTGYDLKPVLLTAGEKSGFYYGFSNEIIWPLFHDLQSLCHFDPSYWAMYEQVNSKFANVIMESLQPSDFVWVHDYHLMNVAKELRDRGTTGKLGFFLHTPFPPMDVFIKLPWRFEILRALIEYDLIGLQTLRDRRNFVQCLRLLIKDVKVQGHGQVIAARIGGREVRIGAFPIGIDYNEFARQASSQEVAEGAWYLHEHFPNRQIILGVDRLDYTKGIPYRLDAYRNALMRYPELHNNVILIQVVVPSREDIPKYQALKAEIEGLVGEINGQFSQSNWVPIHYNFRSMDRPELLSYYRTAEIALVTPLKDGMNLVAKEFCTCSIEENSVLILSEFAGAAAQLQNGALLVNPYDLEGVADAIYQAYTMPLKERRARMRRLRRTVRRYDIYWWVDSFLRAAIAKDLKDFPVLDDYIPQPEEGEETGER